MSCGLETNKLKTLEIYNYIKSGDLAGAKQALAKLTDIYPIDLIIATFKVIPRTITMFAKNKEVVNFLKSSEFVEFLNNVKTPVDNTPATIDSPSKENSIVELEKVNTLIRKSNNWLHKAWQQASLSRLKFIKSLLRDFSNDILGTLYEENENPELLLNKAVKDFITVRLGRLKSYFDSLGIDTSTIEYNMPYDYGVTNPNDRIQRILKEYRKYFYNPDGTPSLTFNELQAFENTNAKASDRKKAEAFANYLTIDPVHFDFFVKNYLSTLSIKNSRGKLTTADNKYGISLGHGKQNTTWQEEDSLYVISKMVDSLVLTKISSWPLYRKHGLVWLPSSNEYATTNSVVNVFAKIMSIPTLKIGTQYDIENSPIILKLRERFLDIFGYKEIRNLETGEITNEYVIDRIINNYISGKTISNIISSISLDWEHLIPVAMFLLCEEENGESILESQLKYDSDNPSKLSMNDNEIASAITIYKNMLDPTIENSLINQTKGKNGFDIYQMIGQIFLTHERKELFGINETQDGVLKVYYSTGKANQRLNYLLNILNGYYCPLKDINIPRTTIETNFDGKDKSVTITIEPFKLEGTPNKYLIEVTNNNIKFFINGKLERINNLKAKDVLKELSFFFQSALHLDFNGLLDVYRGILGGKGEDDLNTLMLKNLYSLSGHLIYDYEVSKKLSNLDTSDFKELAKSYYDGKTPSLVSGVSYNQINTFKSNFPLISKLSVANDVNTGYAGDVIVKGGAGELINLVVLSSLSTKFHAFFNEKSKPEGSAISHFSILDATKRITFLRDYVSKKGDVKSATSMSVEEFFFASLFYDFYGLDASSSLDSIYGSTIGVLSDKPNIARLELFRNSDIQVDENTIKKLKDLSASELKKVAVRELGEYYLKMYGEIKRNLSILNNYSALANGNQEFYNIDNDYINTRNFSKNELKEDIHNAILAALRAGEDIEINEFLYFLWDKHGNLHAKHSVFAELSKNDVIVGQENSTQFFKRKEAEFVVNLLLDLVQGIRFTDLNGLKIDSNAIRTMIRKNLKKGDDNKIDFKSKNNWATRNNLIIAKILYGDTFKDLITKNSLTKWNPYIKLMQYLSEVGDDRIDSSRLDINGEFDLLYFLSVLNNYLKEINDYFKLKKIKSIIKKDSKEAITNKVKKITLADKEYLILKYSEWISNRISNGENEFARENLAKELNKEIITDEELLNWYVENYKLADTNAWIRRKINQAVEDFDIDSIQSLDEVKSFLKLKGIKLSDKFKEEFKKEDEIRNYKLSINPELLRYNTLNYLFSEEGLNSTVGSHVNHEVKPKQYTENSSLLSAIETAMQTKRNVALSGAKNQYTRGDINGMGSTMRIAVMEDPTYAISTINGFLDSGAIKALDGATIGNYITRKEELFSLGSQKAGIDNSKPLGNDLNSRTGTGKIIKTAEFVLTNWRIRNSDVNIRLHRHMNNIPWNNFNGDYLYNYDGDEILYSPVIIYSPAEDAYFLRCNFAIIQNEDGTLGNTVFDEIRIDDEFLKINEWNPGFKVSEEELNRINAQKAVNRNGETIDRVRRLVLTNRPVRTNYELWDLFGGAYSANFKNGVLQYANDNTSLENITLAAHNVGIRTTKGLLTRPTNSDVYLPLKEAKIDWIVTAGAMKLGAANINSIAMMTDDNYEITTLLFDTADIGMLLNPEHETDNSKVTLMTLVINALGLRGFSADLSNKIYEALFNLTELSLKDLFEGIDINLTTGDNKKLKDAMSTLLLKSIIGTTETDGDLLSAIVLQLKDEERNGHDFDIIKSKLPISDPYILNKIVSNFASTMTKFGIRIKFPGSMNVLCPSEGIYKIKNGRLQKIGNTSKYINNDDLLESGANERNFEESELNKALADLEKKESDIYNTIQTLINDPIEANRQRALELSKKLTKLHKITIGASYFVRFNPESDFIQRLIDKDTNPELISAIENGESILLDDLSTYYALRDAILGEDYYLVEDIKKGRELAPYNCIFETTSGLSFMLWDLDPIRHIHMAETNPEAIENIRLNYSDEEIAIEFHIDPNQLDRSSSKVFLNDFKRLIHREKQNELNAIGSGNTGRIFVNGLVYRVVKGSTLVSPYEFIASSNYSTTFGLQIGDDVSEIEKDRTFFLKRFLNKYNNISATDYDVVLRTISGTNYYFMLKDSNINIPEGLTKISDEEFYNSLDWDGGKVYRLDDNGNRLYSLPYTPQLNGIKFNAEIYVDSKGNEIIYTDNLTSFLNSLNYNNIDFGNHILKTNTFEVIKQIGNGNKRLTQQFYEDITDQNTRTLVTTKNPEITETLQEELRIHIKKNIIDLRLKDLLRLLSQLRKGEEINPFSYSPLFRQIIKSAIETHTSFVKSLDYIVSRTPAQSHQSFMPMKLVGFDLSGLNSAYVNRYLLYLQGSDLDIDKASLLGSVFLNGKFIRWSPFMKLDSREHLKASETLPFPTGKKLEIVDSLNERIYDKMDKPIHLIWGDDNRITFQLPDFDLNIHLGKTPEGLWVTDLTPEILELLSPMSLYLIMRAIADKIPNGEYFYANFSHLNRLGFKLGSANHFIKDSSLYDYAYDFYEFTNMFSNVLYKQFDLYDPVNILELSVLINAFNSFGKVLDNNSELTKLLTELVDKHNLYFSDRNSDDAKNAVINYVSSNVFLISCDPVNLVLAMTSVDYLTEIIKGIAAQSPLAKLGTHYDNGNTMTTFRLARLTLSGKLNTGIEASSLKVYEAYNLYIATVLNYGNAEELLRLISTPRNIAGFNINLPANSYCKNIANISSKLIYDELMKVNQDEDAALWLSAMLSLSTDNAKDPTLSKINANPEMIGLYNAGLTLGLPIELLRKVIMSKTGMALANIQTGNIFLGKLGENRVTRAINYVYRGPDFSYLDNIPYTLIKNVLKAYAIDLKDISTRGLINYIIPSRFSSRDLYRARKMVSAMKLKAFGDAENFDYNLPSLNSEIYRRLNKKRKSLRFNENAMLELLQIINEKESLNRSHKREDKKLLDFLTNVENLTKDILELEDIYNTLRDLDKIPNKSGGMYDWAANFQKYMNNIADADMNLKNISNFVERQDTIRNILKFFLDIDSYLDILEQIQSDEGIEGIDGNTYYSLNILEELDKMANEMATIRPILGLNLLLPNSKETQLSFIRKFENTLEDRLTSDDSKLESIKILEKLNELYNKPKHSISMIHFIYSDEYRQAAINAYDDVKYKINVLDVIAKVPHYFGYLKTMASYHYGLSEFSVLYRTLNEIAEKVIRKNMRVSSRKDTELYLKKVSKFVSREINNMFLLLNQITLNLPNIGEVILGTNEGNIAFKTWMDTDMIPRYKQLLSSNKFIGSLEEVAYKNSDNRNTVLNFSPGVNSMSNDEADILRFSEIALDFSQLSKMRLELTTGLPLTDLFFYYDLVSYDRQPSQLSLTPLFNNIFGTNGLILKYVKFISDLDLNGLMPITLDDYTIDRIKRFIAPEVSIFAINEAKTDYIFVKDLKNQQWALLKKKPKESKEPIEGDEDNYYDFEENGFDEMFVPTEEFENSEYEPTTLQTILDLPNCKYERAASFEFNIRNPYLKNNETSEQYSVLNGQVLVSPTIVKMGNESITISLEGELELSEKFAEKFNKILPDTRPQDVFKIIINSDNGNLEYVFDISNMLNMIENPCK